MFRILICVCWQFENKNMSRIGVRHFAQSSSGQDSRMYKLQEKRLTFCEAQLIEW